ncbi:Bestrophin, RFP-TM, chloride channel-domain-containing protein [Mycena sp. CBHHK59/15]|nr:Bestrophin, RFP-TM, chloride channel-domain-containing protein [Mycena sp. CBHHK59/15]
MLTVMGVVIGFVISYRAMTGYDRYWMGRTAWTDVIRNARTMGRLIWYHVPPRLTPFVAGDLSKPGVEEMSKVMAEKRMALDLTEAFAVALKHHLRGELGIYYEDLYDLIKPLHDFEHGTAPTVASAAPPLVSSPTDSTATSAPTPPTAAGTYGTFPTASSASTSTSTSASSTSTATLKPTSHASKRPSPTPAQSTTATATEPAPAPSASTTSLRRPLLPASNPTHEGGALLGRVAPEMIAFAGAVKHATHTWAGPIHAEADLAEYEKGENLPEEVLRVLSEWVSVLEVRGSVPGASLGNILAGIQQFEMSLTLLEHILTTPLPFVYSVHIRVVWLYLFLLPLQLVSDFGWHTVPAVSVGAFVYLGFVAAGEEIEQPFGSDLLRGDCSDFTSHHARLLRRQRPRPRHVLPRHHPAGRAGAQGRAVPQCVPPRLAFLYIHSFCYFDKFHVCTRRGERERAATPHIDGEPRGGGGARRGCRRGSSGERGQ